MDRILAIFFLFALFSVGRGEDCWWSGCQPYTWAQRGCSPGYYQTDSKPCSNGDMYRCCPNGGGSPPAPPPSPPNNQEESGQCSWYGADGEIPDGSYTASGEFFDRNAMKAAHKTLPFGTRVRVTNTANGKSVDVTINDRGPFGAGRILDLTYAAFGQVENRDKGVTPCSFRRL